MFDISASSVRSYDQAVLEHDTPLPNLDGIRALLVDEKSVRKQHNYVTVVLNADTGELLHMQEGKKGESLAVFLRSLSEDQKRSIQFKQWVWIEAVPTNVRWSKTYLMLQSSLTVFTSL
jgi:hypothetical protein